MSVHPRIVLHVDLDCFFASVEARDNASYRGVPLVVGADPAGGNGRGVVSTCSYEARRFGIRSGLPISMAYRLCPHATFVRPDFKRYNEASGRVMALLQQHADSFQHGGIDEAYLDVTSRCRGSWDHARAIAGRIQQEVHDVVGITCSIGIAPTKTLAKIASDMHKPNGITVLEPPALASMLQPLDITRVPGIGKRTASHYRERGFNTLGDIMNAGFPRLASALGVRVARWLHGVVHALDGSPVQERHGRKSISKERTFPRDVSDIDVVRGCVMNLNGWLHEIMKKKGIMYQTVTLKIRFQGFETYTRSRSFPRQDFNQAVVSVMLHRLVDEFDTPDDRVPVRLIGVRFSGLSRVGAGGQRSLLDFSGGSCDGEGDLPAPVIPQHPDELGEREIHEEV